MSANRLVAIVSVGVVLARTSGWPSGGPHPQKAAGIGAASEGVVGI